MRGRDQHSSGRGAERARLGFRDGREREGHVPRLPRGASASEGAGAWADHQRRIDRRQGGLPESRPLQRIEVRGGRFHQRTGEGTRARRRDRQRDLSGHRAHLHVGPAVRRMEDRWRIGRAIVAAASAHADPAGPRADARRHGPPRAVLRDDGQRDRPGRERRRRLHVPLTTHAEQSVAAARLRRHSQSDLLRRHT
ncbi:hypothetical protein BVI2075_600005 [Burkholderia vietnamiensis]|nr:hypothetical protein BVI2075_600005 [Burkholderia vietnamiensis]